jgi:hypothetical protein
MATSTTNTTVPSDVNPNATNAAGPGGFTFGGSSGTTPGSTKVTIHVPADVLKRAGVDAKKFTDTAGNISTVVAGNTVLRNYFENRAAAQGTTLIGTNGKFETSNLTKVFESIAVDPATNLAGALGQLGTYKAAVAKQQAVDLTNQQALVQYGNLNLAAAQTNATAAAKSSAVNSLEGFFAQYGIDTSTVPKNLLDGFTKDFTNLVYNQNIAPTSQTAREMFQGYAGGKLYDAAFPGLKEYNASPAGQTAPMKLSDYTTYRNQFKNLASTYNLPAGFLNDATLKKLVTGGVSMANLTDRIAKGYAAYESASPAEKQLLAKEYGVTPGQAVAYFLDTSPGKVHSLNSIKQAMTAAPLELKAQQVGLTDFGKQQAEQLGGLVRSGALGQPAAIGTPYDFTQAYNAETAAARDAALTKQRMGQAPGTQINTDTLLASQIAGYTGNQNVLQGQSQVQAQRATQTAEQSALAPFEKGGGYEETQKGVIGAGSARQ